MSRFRLAALLAAGALGVHEARYLVGYGADAQRALAEHGHGYLTVASALTCGLVVVAGLALVLGLSHARPAGTRVGSWLAAGTALSAIYVVQELAEGAFSPGHPVGVEGVVGHGGWSAFAFALAFGALIALLERRARQVSPWAPPLLHAPTPPPALGVALVSAPLRLLSPLASAHAARGPPLHP